MVHQARVIGSPAQRMSTLVNRLGRAVHCLQFAEGLNPAQWEALRYLTRANRYSRTPSALADYLGTTKGTASQTIKALEAKGMVARERVVEDGRAVRLTLTQAGLDILARDPLQRMDQVAATLAGDLPAANQTLQTLVNQLQATFGLREFGLCNECTHFCKNATEGAKPAAAAPADAANGPHQCGL
ncbi:MAG: MarR family winged helix-turn-helix transcriptional regulator, partial [Alphaproteobacteria bacterium]